MGAVVNCVAYADGRRVAEVKVSQISEVLEQPEQFVWIGLREPDEGLLRTVQKEFGLHDLAIEDAHNAHQRPKVEVYGDSIFVVLRTAQITPDRAEPVVYGETHLFVGSHYLVSVRHGPSQPYVEVRSRCEQSPSLLSQGPGFVLYALMDAIVDQYFPVLNALEEEVEALEEKIFGEEVNNREVIPQIYALRTELLHLKRTVSPLIDACNRLMRFDLAMIHEETRPYFRDVYDHVCRINEMVDTLRELLNSAAEANFSLVSISQNEVMKRLGGWAAIIAVPTMIAGIYGMNFKDMPELSWSFGYPLILALSIGCSSYLYYLFKRSGWL